MDEQLRILGLERQADLDREARRFALADLVQGKPRGRPWLVRRAVSVRSRLWRGSRRMKPGSAAAVSRR
jgi:hypothetical protein